MKKRYLLLLPVFALMLPAGLNYSGMCLAEGGWLSDEERIDIAIQRIISQKKVWISDGAAGSQEYDFVPYASVKEFKKKNPNCCTVYGGAIRTIFHPTLF